MKAVQKFPLLILEYFPVAYCGCWRYKAVAGFYAIAWNVQNPNDARPHTCHHTLTATAAAVVIVLFSN